MKPLIRIIKLCEDIASIFPADREMVLAKELTKTFETFVGGTAAEVCSWLEVRSFASKRGMGGAYFRSKACDIQRIVIKRNLASVKNIMRTITD